MDEELRNYHLNLPGITFEGAKLPRFAMLLSHAGAVASVPEQTGLWFWRFTIAVGGKSDSASVVEHHACVLLHILAKGNAGSVPSTVSAELYNSKEVYSDWIRTLQLILEKTIGRSVCRWEVEAYFIPPAAYGAGNRD